MKQKVFTLLTLLVLCVTGAWGATETITTVQKDTEYSGTCVTIGKDHFAQNQSDATYIKMRTGNYSNTWVFTVKSGYTITGISIKGYSNNSGATISMTSLKANGTEQLDDAVVFPVTGTAEGSYANINKSGFEVVGGQTIVCAFDNSNIITDSSDPNYNNAKNKQIMAKITITYEAAGPNLNGASSSPAASATSVALSGSGFLKFSKNLSSVTPANITISPSENGEALSSIAIDGTDASKVNYAWSGLQYGTEYTVNVAANAVNDGTAGNAATSLSFTTRPENFTVSYNVSSYKGTVANIFGNDVTTDDDYTLPATNKYLSSDNKTQTGWSDGTTTYALGATIEDVTSNITLTPVFTSNAGETMVKTLKGNDSDYNVTWNFRASNATLNLEGTTGYLIQQQSINGAPVDMPIYINTASGKVNNFDAVGDPRTDQWAQINNGTVLTIPVINNSVVTLNTYNEASSTTINGGDWDATSGSTGNYTATYTYTGEGGTIDIVADGDISYISTINVTYPYDPSKVFELNFNNQGVPGVYFNITNGADASNTLFETSINGKSVSKLSGYNYNLGSIVKSSTGTSKLVTKAQYTNISKIEIAIATEEKTSNTLAVEVSPYADFSSDVTIVRSASTFTSNNNEYTTVSMTTNATGYIRLTLSTGKTSGKYTAIAYMKVTAHGGTENISTASGKNYATYVTANALDFSTVSDDIKAYVAASEAAGAKITFTGKDAVPAGTPILVKTTSVGAIVNVPVATSAPAAVGTNKLIAGTGAAISYDAGESQFYYILTNGQFKAANNSPVAVGKAYLSLDGAPAANELTISFDDEDGGVTGIAEMKAMRNVENETFYDLQGRRVAQPAKGLYIVNGRKVIVK